MFLKTILQTVSIIPFLWPSISAQSSTACNNSPSLCSKTYNNITHLGAHDSAFVRDASTNYATAGDQYFNSTVQLSAGVRLLSAQVHKANGSNGQTEWHLCHTSCSLMDAGTLTSWLSAIKTWMDANTNEVVTILLVNSDDASASDLGSQFSSSGIDKYAYTPSVNGSAQKTWPTLQSMISNGTRLVTFVASLTESSAYPYLMDEFTYMFENPYDNTSPSNFSCQPDRPSSLSNQPSEAISSGRLFMMNHFLYQTELLGIEVPDVTDINSTNAQTGSSSLGEWMTTCTKLYAKEPTFVLVDFFNVGPAIASVDAANGVTDATGRKSVTANTLEQDTSTSAGRMNSGSMIAVVVAVIVAVIFGM